MPRPERKTAWVCVRFSRRSNDRGGNPLGCACGIRGAPRYDKKRHPLTVGRGPVPRHRSCTHHPTLAGETRSDARVASEGPRATIKNATPSPGSSLTRSVHILDNPLPTFHTPQPLRRAGLPHIVHYHVSYGHLCAVSPQIRVILIGIIFANDAVVRRTKP